MLSKTKFRAPSQAARDSRLAEYSAKLTQWEDKAKGKFELTDEEKDAIPRCIDELVNVSGHGEHMLMYKVLGMTPADFKAFAVSKAKCVGGDEKAPVLTAFISFTLRTL